MVEKLTHPSDIAQVHGDAISEIRWAVRNGDHNAFDEAIWRAEVRFFQLRQQLDELPEYEPFDHPTSRSIRATLAVID